MKRLIPALLLGSFCVTTRPAATQANATNLDAVRNRQRVLLVFSNGDNQLAEAQLTVAGEHAAGFRERDLVLAGLSGTNPAVPTLLLTPVAERAARKQFHILAGEFTVVLIGKDGGEKLRSHRPILWETLESTIDAMPMRKAEMRR